MLITVDIGNTNVSIGILKDLVVVQSFKIETGVLNNQKKARDLITKKIAGVLPPDQKFCGVYVSSVVPVLNKNIRLILRPIFIHQE